MQALERDTQIASLLGEFVIVDCQKSSDVDLTILFAGHRAADNHPTDGSNRRTVESWIPQFETTLVRVTSDSKRVLKPDILNPPRPEFA